MEKEIKVNTEKEMIEEFVKEYEALCRKHGLVHAFTPQWKQSMDTGTYSMVIVPQVAKLNLEE